MSIFTYKWLFFFEPKLNTIKNDSRVAAVFTRLLIIKNIKNN